MNRQIIENVRPSNIIENSSNEHLDEREDDYGRTTVVLKINASRHKSQTRISQKAFGIFKNVPF